MMRTSYDHIKNFENIYERDGAYHHFARGFRSWFLKDNYAAIAKECLGANRVIDLACGEGCLGPYLEVKWLVGVDYSQKALDLNRRLHVGIYDELHLGDMRDLNDLNLSQALYDAVVCSLSLMYLLKEDLVRCLRQVHERLVAGGYFVFTYPMVGKKRAGNLEACELLPGELTDELIQAGFRVERMLPICPLISRGEVEKSEEESRQAQAFESYQRAKERMTLETSYHFLCRARKPRS